MSESDPNYELKKSIILSENNIDDNVQFEIVGNMREQKMKDLLSWMRLVVYDGEIDVLFDHVLTPFNDAQEKAHQNGENSNKIMFEKYIEPIDIHNELAVWTRILK